MGIEASLNVSYLGAFRVEARGDSTSDYAVGTLGYNSDNNSIFMAGHSSHNAIAEFEVPFEMLKEPEVSDLVEAAVLQDYVTILDKRNIGNQTDKIVGILYHEENLLVSSEVWYDGNGDNQDNLQVFTTGNNLRASAVKGMLQIDGGARAAGYMSKIPQEWQDEFNADHITGWASNYSITNRYSQGPSLYSFNPDQAVNAVVSVERTIDAKAKMMFPFEDGKELVAGGSGFVGEVSPVWGPLAGARYGFIVPNSDIFMVVGHHGGLHSGVGYKITQDNGNVCGGGCPKSADDYYNYFWLFSIQDILSAQNTYSIQPISYGKWSHPYDNKGLNKLLGATYDSVNNRLFVSLGNAGSVGKYDRPPLILAYKVEGKSN
jgi:hypothetical protein